MTVDLDALAAELTDAGFSTSREPQTLVVFKYPDHSGFMSRVYEFGCFDIETTVDLEIDKSSQTSSYRALDCIDIIRRHVSPEPHDAARLRETIARVGFCSFIGETNLETHLWTDLHDESKEVWFEVADAVIRAITGAK